MILPSLLVAFHTFCQRVAKDDNVERLENLRECCRAFVNILGLRSCTRSTADCWVNLTASKICRQMEIENFAVADLPCRIVNISIAGLGQTQPCHTMIALRHCPWHQTLSKEVQSSLKTIKEVKILLAAEAEREGSNFLAMDLLSDCEQTFLDGLDILSLPAADIFATDYFLQSYDDVIPGPPSDDEDLATPGGP